MFPINSFKTFVSLYATVSKPRDVNLINYFKTVVYLTSCFIRIISVRHCFKQRTVYLTHYIFQNSCLSVSLFQRRALEDYLNFHQSGRGDQFLMLKMALKKEIFCLFLRIDLKRTRKPYPKLQNFLIRVHIRKDILKKHRRCSYENVLKNQHCPGRR